MKKTIKILTDKMEALTEKSNGTLDGGFTAVRGGVNAMTATGTNDFICTNASNCTQSTNNTGCTNSGTCFI